MHDTHIAPTSGRPQASRRWRLETMSTTITTTKRKMIMTEPAPRTRTLAMFILLFAVTASLLTPASAQDQEPASETPAATPTNGQDTDALTAERTRRDLMAQKTYLLVDHYLQNARDLEERLDFTNAELELQKAPALDPTNPVVARYLQEIQALLGRPEAEAALLRRSARDRYEAQRQQKRTLALTDLSAAREAYNDGDYELLL